MVEAMAPWQDAGKRKMSTDSLVHVWNVDGIHSPLLRILNRQ
jgi:hypothetical protein